MPRDPRDPDTDLQRGFEPLRTIFTVLALLLGFAASARAHASLAPMHTSISEAARASATAAAGECANQPDRAGETR